MPPPPAARAVPVSSSSRHMLRNTSSISNNSIAATTAAAAVVAGCGPVGGLDNLQLSSCWGTVYMCAAPSSPSARPYLIHASCLHSRQHKFTTPSAFSDDVAVCSQAAASLVEKKWALQPPRRHSNWVAPLGRETQHQASCQVSCAFDLFTRCIWDPA